MCFSLVFLWMENISKGKLGWNSSNAAPWCCWRKGTCTTQILGRQLIRTGKTALLLELLHELETLKQTRTRVHALIHMVYICQISVSLCTVLLSSELISEPSQSFPQGLLKECGPEFPWKSFPPLMIPRTEWCHPRVQGVLGTEALTPTMSAQSHLQVCEFVCCVCVCLCEVVWSAKVKNGSVPVSFNEASEECGGWTACVNKWTIWTSPEWNIFILCTREENCQEEFRVNLVCDY